MTTSSRRRVRWAALAAVLAAAAAGTAVAVRAWRHQHPPATPPAAPAPAPGAPAAPAASRVRHNWAGLIAVPSVAIVVLAFALVVSRPTPIDPNGAYLTTVDTKVLEDLHLDAYQPSWSPAPTPDVSAEQRCTTPMGWTQPYPLPSRSGFSVTIVRQALNVAPCRTVVLGTTVTLSRYPGQPVEVTAVPAVDPRVQPTTVALPDGRHRVSFRLHIRNLGTATTQLPFTFLWAADKRSGWLPAAAPADAYVGLTPNDEADQFVAFDVSQDAQLARLRLSLEPGYSEQTVDWVLG